MPEPIVIFFSMSAAVVMMEAATAVVPESQRLIAVSLGKIAASRSQKGGINLHKNLLVATVLHKARTAYMVQHYNRQRAAAAAVGVQGVPQVNQPEPVTPTPPTTTPSIPAPVVDNVNSVSSTSSNVDMKEESCSKSSASVESGDNKSHDAAPLAGPPSTSQSAFPGGAQVSSVQMSRCEDKENSPPPSPCDSTVGGVEPPSTLSPECQARLQEGNEKMDASETSCSPLSSSHAQSVSHPASNNTRTYVRQASCSVPLKRRRLMVNNEHVSAPKVRILEQKVSTDNNSNSKDSVPEPMLCDSPQISSLVNIFNTSFANGLAGGQRGGDASVRTVVTHLSSSVTGHKLSENLSCAKEISMGGSSLDSSLRQPLALAV